MKIEQTKFTWPTSGRGTTEITGQINRWIEQTGVSTGLAHLFIQHTSASLLLTENADPRVRTDIEQILSDLAPDDDDRYTHTAEGPDDMAAHMRTVLTESALTLPVRSGRLALGTWQGIYLFEHRHQPHERTVVVTITGQ
jgi:secondary thiamine-phosphate synthase enzyme